jgi:hypothetical protein
LTRDTAFNAQDIAELSKGGLPIDAVSVRAAVAGADKKRRERGRFVRLSGHGAYK